ncbi:hypothetical protein GTC6_13065 [Gordonia terrae C-6]|uniref:Uncharacterized protein n=1 Tax=Gordonia terrae C-6 TaxID=1316928 RepID=R7Y8G8_9ACTN|nr:hypothetical protein GTC6_13065 [Gordonia terrae C-6]
MAEHLCRAVAHRDPDADRVGVDAPEDREARSAGVDPARWCFRPLAARARDHSAPVAALPARWCCHPLAALPARAGAVQADPPSARTCRRAVGPVVGQEADRVWPQACRPEGE